MNRKDQKDIFYYLLLFILSMHYYFTKGIDLFRIPRYIDNTIMQYIGAGLFVISGLLLAICPIILLRINRRIKDGLRTIREVNSRREEVFLSDYGILNEYYPSLLSAWIGFRWWKSAFVENTYTTFGDRGILYGLFIGLPLGSLVGIILTEKLVYRIRGINIMGILGAFIISIPVNLYMAKMENVYGLMLGYYAAFFVTAGCLFGYHAPRIIVKRIKNRDTQ